MSIDSHFICIRSFQLFLGFILPERKVLHSRRANSNYQPYPSVLIFCSHIPSFPLKLRSRFCIKTIPLPKHSSKSNAQVYLLLYLCTPLPLASAHMSFRSITRAVEPRPIQRIRNLTSPNHTGALTKRRRVMNIILHQPSRVLRRPLKVRRSMGRLMHLL